MLFAIANRIKEPASRAALNTSAVRLVGALLVLASVGCADPDHGAPGTKSATKPPDSERERPTGGRSPQHTDVSRQTPLPGERVSTVKDKSPVVPEEHWEVNGYETDEGPVVVSFYTKAKEIDRANYPHCARVIIPAGKFGDAGKLEQKEWDELYALEDELANALQQAGVSCVLLARMTHRRTRELVFQLNDWECFRPPAGRWMLQHKDRDIDVSEHEGWSFFDQSIWPSQEEWMLISDRHVVENLIKNGSDPAKEHELEFVFVGGDVALKQAKQRLLSRGYVAPAGKADAGQLIMVRKLPLDLNQILQESLANQRLAEEVKVEYDGWGAEVRR